MTNPNDPAFSADVEGVNGVTGRRVRHGLTKREYFAAIILQGLCARPMQADIVINGIRLPYDRAAIAIADSLIAELNRSKSNGNEGAE